MQVLDNLLLCSGSSVAIGQLAGTERLCGIAFGLRRVGHASRVLTIKIKCRVEVKVYL